MWPEPVHNFPSNTAIPLGRQALDSPMQSVGRQCATGIPDIHQTDRESRA